MDTQILEDIGLTNAEIKVYIALLELGSTTAGPLIDRTGLQNSVVHMTLHRLLDKGFASYYMEGKRTHYQASNPKHLLDYIGEKKDRLERLLPELLLRRESAETKAGVETYRGVKGMRQILYELLGAGGMEHHTIGSPVESVMMGEAFWADYHRKRARKGIWAKLIFNESLRGWTEKVTYPKRDLRFLDAGVEPLTETIIRNDTVGILLWTEKPTGILVRDRPLADSYEKYFQLLWQRAKE
ncbi:MAG: hypothetical protein HY544_04845 [Candidatus Diapherotrites archaeon]|uniref:Transcription regulator TrmB N-terminal domain-containing protein n=1 Tax=Candidatus Iainarchaeum sp. TaxID=3101447 RepID=A0A8T3YNG7_9ARCH|nr:hypothetical protein [Candidatus Diapherotrites archaeon]